MRTDLKELYFDNNATTPLDEVVLEGLRHALEELWGNPSSPHPVGERALAAVDRARASVARLLGSSPGEVVFTSGGTESIHTALHVALAERPVGGVALTSSVEHAATLRPLSLWERRGTRLEAVGVDRTGRLRTDELLERLSGGRDVRLVSLLAANNETGVLLPPEELASIREAAREAGALVHVDAIQVPGKLPLGVWAAHADLVSISAHKFHGPKGAGALFCAEEVPLPEIGFLSGGPQEGARRAGTSNVPGIVGLGIAAERALEHLEDPSAPDRLAALRDRLEVGLAAGIEGLVVHGAGADRLPNTANVGVPGVDGEVLHLALAAEGLCVTSGAACGSRKRKPSDVLVAMGVEEELARASLRFSLSRRTQEEEVDMAVERVCGVVAAVR